MKDTGIGLFTLLLTIVVIGGCSDSTSNTAKTLCESASTSGTSWKGLDQSNLKVGLPTEMSWTFHSVDIDTQQTGTTERAATFLEPAGGLAGAVVVRAADDSGEASVETLLTDDVAPAVRETGQVHSSQTDAPYDNHLGAKTIIARYRISPDSGDPSVQQFRNRLLLSIGRFGAADMSDLPNWTVSGEDTFIVTVSVMQSVQDDKGGSNMGPVISLNAVPATRYDSGDPSRYLGTDLVDTTNLAVDAGASSSDPGCDQMALDTFQPGVEFYWVLDQSGTMSDEIGTVQDFASDFAQTLSSTRLNHRFGVTNMDPSNAGKLAIPPGWHADSDVFRDEVGERATQNGCRDLDDWGCSDFEEYGLYAAMFGIKYMSGEESMQPAPEEEIRSDAEVVIIAMSDEDANSVKNQDFPDGITGIEDYEAWFSGRATLHAIVGTPNCGSENGDSYRRVASATGGTTSSICSGSLEDTIDTILRRVSGRVSAYKLSNAPVSSTLRVFVGDTEIRRSHRNGFQYFPSSKKIAFFGDAQTIASGGESLPEVTMVYQPAAGTVGD